MRDPITTEDDDEENHRLFSRAFFRSSVRHSCGSCRLSNTPASLTFGGEQRILPPGAFISCLRMPADETFHGLMLR
jgi:hypothetical protein